MMRPPRRAIPTLPGLFALGAPTVLGLAAVTATNNLLFLILGATLGAIVLSGILSERNVRPIAVEVRALGAIYAGASARIEVRFVRTRGKATAYDLRFREAPGSAFLPWRRLSPPEIIDTHLPVLEERSASVLAPRVFPERGRARLGLSEVSTRYPFGLLVKARDVEPTLELLVRPRLVDPPPALLRPPRLAGEGESAQDRGSGLDVHGLRERVEHDALHRVHALRSLALGRQVVLEMSGVERPKASLRIASDPSSEPQAFERTLEVAQAVLRKWSTDGYAVGLETHDRLFTAGEAEVDVLLDHLADLQPSARPPRRRPGPGPCLVPLGARPPSEGRWWRVDGGGNLRPGGESS